MGQADYLSLGTWNALCSMCGHKFKASQLTKNWQGQYRCSRCQESRHPQDFVRAVPDVQTPPWTQPGGNDVYLMPTLELNDSADVTAIEVAGTPTITITGTGTSSSGTALIVTVGSGVAMTLLEIVVDPTDPDAYVADSVVINNSGSIDAVINDSNADLTVNSWPGGYYGAVAYTLTAADNGGSGEQFGFDPASSPPGSISPTTFSGRNVVVLISTTVGGTPYTQIGISGSVAQNFLTVIVLNGFTLLSSAATLFFEAGGNTYWQFANQQALTATGTYSVTIA